MRKDLELLEKIDQYLHQQMSPGEESAFRNSMAASPEIKEAVEQQRILITAIDRSALAEEIQKAEKRFRINRLLGQWGWPMLAFITVLITLVLLLTHSPKPLGENFKEKLIQTNETGSLQCAPADRILTAQTFQLNPARDTVIETRGGLVLALPAYCFLQMDGSPAEGKIEVRVKEALDPVSILKAGLSTIAGQNMLETAGMFYLDGKKSAEPLRLDSTKGVYVEIPADTARPGMHLYHGSRLPNGVIQWGNPRPLATELVPVDIKSLNFYPPGYLDSLSKWGLNIQNKEFTDSLYYAMEYHQAEYRFNYNELSREEMPVTDTSYTPKGDSTTADNHFCGITPSRIRTIWDEKFQNSNLSTREFEKRLKLIHRTGKNEILDLYVKNLGKPLYESDSMAILLLKSEQDFGYAKEFLAYYKLHEGKTAPENNAIELLKSYYNTKRKAVREALIKTQNDFWNRQAALDEISIGQKSLHRLDSLKAEETRFNQEYRLNLKNAWAQLGYDSSIPQIKTATYYYVAKVINTGWNNIDKAVNEATLNRSTLSFTDSLTGKKAIIQYSPVSFQIEKKDQFESLFVYLVPQQLNSFVRLIDTGGVFIGKLNELIQYNLVCVGYKSGNLYYSIIKNVSAKNYSPLTLIAGNEKELAGALDRLGIGSQGQPMQQEVDYQNYISRDKIRSTLNENLKYLTYKTLKIVSPCYLGSYPPSTSNLLRKPMARKRTLFRPVK